MIKEWREERERKERALIKILIKRKSFHKQGGPKKKEQVGDSIEEKKRRRPI